MKNKIVVILTLGLFVGIAGSGWANDPTPSAPSTSPSSSDDGGGKSIAGTVQNVDTHLATVKIQDPTGDEDMVIVDQETKFLRNGVPIQMAKLRKGDYVQIRNAMDIVDPNYHPSAAN